MCKKIKLDTSVDLYTTPSPIKAIQQMKCELNKKIKLHNTDKTLLKNLATKKILQRTTMLFPL